MDKKAPFGFERPQESPGFLLWQTTMSWQRLIKKALEPYSLSHAQFVMLALLLWFEKRGTEVSQGILVDWSKLDKMTVSKSVKKLAQMGYVKHFENSEDGRAKTVLITSSGKKLAHKVVPVVETVDREFFGSLDQKNQRSLVEVLNRLDLS